MAARFCIVGLLIGLSLGTLRADELVESQNDLFEVHVRPTLTNHCVKCHGPDKQEGGLTLTDFDSLRKGGDSGPAIDTENLSSSLLLSAIRHESLEMPPDEKLNDKTIAGIEAWFAAGVPWPNDAKIQPKPVIDETDRKWWSYQPIVDPAVPEVQDNGWCRTDIDRFIYAKLAQQGIAPSQEASASALVRRLSFDLTGLPPTLDDLSRLDNGEDFYSGAVEEYLNSHAYGEQQARYWLDLVRYADSDGYRADAERPHAKKYRDYVIRAFNQDLPYDKFIQQQLAGDELFPDDTDAITATMYLRHWIYEHNQRDVEQQWHEILNDITETTADVFLAQGLKCARCHDHKYDPLLQKDFYRLKAFFTPLMPREDLPVASVAQREAYNTQWQKWNDSTESIRRLLYEIENPPLLEHATREGFDKFIDEIKQMVLKFPSDRGAYELQIAAMASRQYDVHPDKLPTWLDGELERLRQHLLNELAKHDHLKPQPLPTATFVATDVGPEAPANYIDRDPRKPDVRPGYLTILHEPDAEILPSHPALQTTGRRSTLAKWMTSKANPLVARVIVNRVWQQHFGVGLVASSSDFGRLGTPPSHPELLDWLATRFMDEGWSIKGLHRRIVSSSVYRQSSLRKSNEHIKMIDPANRLLWKMNSRRLDGEEIMDAMLVASDELGTEGRAIYKPVMRNTPEPMLASFDGPDRIRSVGERHKTTTSTQALLMLNSEWTWKRAQMLHERLKDLPENDFIKSLHRKLYSREATEEEIRLAQQFIYDYSIVVREEQNVAPEANEESNAEHKSNARLALTHTMMNSSEAIYLD